MRSLATPPAKGKIRRFDIHQRIQHVMLATSFFGLVLTGWPLRAPESGVSRALLGVFGGPIAAGAWHRLFGAILITAAIYHLVYVVSIWRRGELSLAMLPSLNDVKDVFANVLFMLGLSPRRARFGRYTYWEKFDYWAVFWGMAIIGGSGLILWFPAETAKFLPGWVLPIAHVLHGDEAVLALMCIFIWHFYNGHFRKQFFPMNWVFLTGELPEEVVRDEYGRWWAEIERERNGQAGAPPPEAPVSVRSRVWPVAMTGAMTGLLLAGIAAWVALGSGMSRIGPNVPSRFLAPGWGESLGLPPRGAEPSAVTIAARPHEPSAEASLKTLAGIPLDSLEQAGGLACFKSCHSAQRFAETPFKHKAHVGKGLECATCHLYVAHERSAIDEKACKDCHP